MTVLCTHSHLNMWFPVTPLPDLHSGHELCILIGSLVITTVHNVEWDEVNRDWKVTYCIAKDIFTKPLAHLPISLKNQIINLMPSNSTLAHRVEEVRRAVESDVLLVNHNEPDESS